MENITLGQLQTIIVFIATFITSGGIIMAFALKIGKKILDKSLEPFNKRIDEMDKLRVEQHDETLERINKLEEIVDQNDIDVVRNRIVAFEQICRLDINNDSIKKYQYDTAYKDIDKWADYHKKYPSLNGEINMAIENINEHYKKAKF